MSIDMVNITHHDGFEEEYQKNKSKSKTYC